MKKKHFGKLGLLMFVAVLITCFICISASFAEECTHSEIKWLSGIYEYGDWIDNSEKYNIDPYSCDLREMFSVGICQNPDCQKRIPGEFLGWDNKTKPHDWVFESYSEDSDTDLFKCGTCNGHTRLTHKCSLDIEVPNTREFDHVSEIKGNDQQHKVYLSAMFACRCERYQCRNTFFEMSDHTHVERIKKKELYAYNDANVSEVNHIVVYSAAFQCRCGHEIPDDELWEEEGEHTFPNLVENKPTTPWEFLEFVSNDKDFHTVKYLAFFSCKCGFAGDRREITNTDHHTFDRSVSYPDSDGSRYYKCTLSSHGCNAKCKVKKDDHEHELTLGTISSTGPSSALGGRQQYCRICGATECEINGCDYKPATCTDPQICSKCGKTSGTILGHLYDYDHPQEENTYVVKFFCKRPGCTDYTAHSHCYADVGDPKKTENIRKHNDAKHQREYDILQECQSTLGNGQKCTASYWRFYEWREESHTMNPVGDPVMKGAYQFSSSDSRYKTKHMRKYEQNYKCKCGYEAVREDRKDEAHSWHKEVVKAATCTTDGTKTRICAGCDYVDTVLNGKALGHLYDYNNPWEQSPNLVLFRCKRNGCTSYEAHSHTFVDTGADPKPTSKYRKIADNYSKHERKYEVPQKCSYSKCKATNTGTLWKKESHIWDGWNTTKTPTCVSVGSEQRTCTMCDITQKKEIPIDKTNHKWPTITSCTAKQKCTRSGCTATRTPGHRLDSGTVTKSPTCSSTGTKLFKCTRSGCTHTETASLATIGHIYTGVNNRCKFCGKPKNVEVQ